MEDGQFDESGLTLGEIRTIENSMITSILAIKHSRIKYPEKEPEAENKTGAHTAIHLYNGGAENAHHGGAVTKESES